MKLLNKIVVITGAARGLGLETARKLKQQGATVIGIDRLEPHTALNFDAYYLLDLCDRERLDEAAASILERFGDIDILVYNAGVLTLERGETGVNDDVRRALNSLGAKAVSSTVEGGLKGLLKLAFPFIPG